jgi:hypothetical protein
LKDTLTLALERAEKYRFAIQLTYESEDISKIGNFWQALQMLFKGEVEVKFPGSNP